MPFTFPCLKRHFHVERASSQEVPLPGLHLYFHSGHERGVLLENVDETQLLLLSLLDGHHSFEALVAHLQAQHAAVTTEEVAEILDDLASYGLLEDVAVAPPADLTATDLGRYASQIRFFSIFDTTGKHAYEMQAQLKRARVTVLGLGGLGSNILIGLAAAGIGHLRGVDFDVVELSNLNRQVLYSAADLGRPKALAAAEHVRCFNPEIHFEPLLRRLDGPESIIEVIEGSDVVAMCADSPASIALWMNKAALQTGIPFLMGGYRGGVAEVGPLVVPFQTSCLACEPAPSEQEVPEALAWINDAYRLRHPTSHVVSALAAHLSCSELIKYLTGLGEPATCNTTYTLDVEHLTLTPTPHPRSQVCVMCSDHASLSRDQRNMQQQPSAAR